MMVSPHRQATVGEIDSLSRTLAARIEGGTSPPGSLVALAAPNGPGFLGGLLALRRAGRVVLLLDSLAPAEVRRRVAATLGAAAILECDTAWPSSPGALRLSPITTEAAPWVPGGETAVVKLTSGSTGSPRGVAMGAEALLTDEAALWVAMGLREDDRLLTTIPLSHSYGFTSLALASLVRGLTLVLPADPGPFAPATAARQLGATVFPTVPAYLQGLLKMSQPPPWPTTVRLVVSAGAVLPPSTAARFRETYGQPIHTFYGSSESGGICYDPGGGAAERGTVGIPVGDVRVSLKPLEGQDEGAGLVVVESAGVGERYLPEPDPRLAGGRFETSDLGVWRGGELALRRRVDRVINVRGRKVDPSEVEAVLATLRGVEEAVVIGVATPDGEDEIVRAVVACPSGGLGYEDVVGWCRPRLAEHKVPRSVAFVNAIPRTSRGKIDRSALLDGHAALETPGGSRG